MKLTCIDCSIQFQGQPRIAPRCPDCEAYFYGEANSLAMDAVAEMGDAGEGT